MPADHSSAPRPLHGVTVLDLTRVLAGPYCSMMLGDFGADVVKVEQPGRGDDSRSWTPPAAGGESAYYLCTNRNKRSVTLNLQREEGRAILLDLARKADVLLENFKPGTLERWGLGYEQLRQENPGLIFATVASYGEGSPYYERPGYDFVIQAMSGLMAITGEADGNPMKLGVAIVDLVTGLHLCSSILAALRERDRSGEGQRIEISLLDSALSVLANVASNFLISGQDAKRYGNAHPNVVPYQTFRARDGYLAVATGNDTQYQTLCRLVGRADLGSDERFARNADRHANRDVLIPLLEEAFGQEDAAHWVDLLVGAGVPAGPINTIAQALADPHVAARQMVQHVPHPTAGTVPLVAPPARFSRTPSTIDRHPPLLGEHTGEVLAEKLGMAPEAVEELRAQGIV